VYDNAGNYSTFPPAPTLATPAITEISPLSGPVTGGTTVTVTGTNFVDGVTVTFDGIPAVVLDVQSTAITVLTPPQAPGVVDVVVTNPDGQGARLLNGFEYFAPLRAGFEMTFRGNSAFEGEAISVRIRPRESATVQFSAQDRSSGSIVTWHWAIDGVSVSTSPSFTKSLGPGEYEIELIVAGTHASSSARGIVFVNQITTPVKVVGVEDGDTLLLESKHFACDEKKLRLVGVDTPELDGSLKDRDKWSIRDEDVKDLAKRSKDATFDWLSTPFGPPSVDNPVEIQALLPDGRVCDPLNRLLAYVFRKGDPVTQTNSLTADLVSGGLGLAFLEEWHRQGTFEIADSVETFLLLRQLRARQTQAGFWGSTGDLPEWEVRSRPCGQVDMCRNLPLSFPLDSVANIPRISLLLWERVPNARMYSLEIGRTVETGDLLTFPDPLLLTVSRTFAITPTLELGRYWWRVTAVGPGGTSIAKSPVWSFTVGSRLP
jgi:endonuclease YncB( thermonuclease family)